MLCSETKRLNACMVHAQPCAAQLLVQSKVPGTINMQLCSPEYLIDDRSKVCHEPNEVAKSLTVGHVTVANGLMWQQ